MCKNDNAVLRIRDHKFRNAMNISIQKLDCEIITMHITQNFDSNTITQISNL